ncbi:neural cell adhesion molecule L1.1-like isoform X1 [Tubulanus polymorphus]|uniref:neural cell adhesion molecule L1.1-like isoform X1 n=1 Tax=Tubulanus polymorphus TaxID=672921 RepID=UPI003DA2D263
MFAAAFFQVVLIFAFVSTGITEIYYPPVLTCTHSPMKSGSSISVVYGSPVSINCAADASPAASYRLNFEKTVTDPIPGENATQYAESPGQLQIPSFNGRLAGFYTYQASNDFGTAVAKKLHFKTQFISVDNSGPVKSLLLAQTRSGMIPCDGTFLDYNGINFEWKYYAASSLTDAAKTALTAVPGPLVNLDNGRLIVDRTSGSLYFTAGLLTDSHASADHYFCVASLKSNASVVGVGSISKVTTQLKSGDNPSLEHPPAFMKTSAASVDVNQDEDVTLVCIASGKPTPKISWTKDGTALASNLQSEYNTHVLIKKAQTSDSGVYKCTAHNSQNTISQNIVLTVYGKLAIMKEPPVEIVVIEGKKASFQCTGSGSPHPRIKWYINTQPYAADQNPRIKISGGTFTIENAKIPSTASDGTIDPGDNMVVQCELTNNHQTVLFNTGIHTVNKSTCPDCENGGKCIRKSTAYVCDCTAGFFGETCEKCDPSCPGSNLPLIIGVTVAAGVVVIAFAVILIVLGVKKKLCCQKPSSTGRNYQTEPGDLCLDTADSNAGEVGAENVVSQMN